MSVIISISVKFIYISAIETELREVQQRSSELQKRAKSLSEQIDSIFKGKRLTATKQDYVIKDELQNSIQINEAALLAVSLTSSRTKTVVKLPTKVNTSVNHQEASASSQYKLESSDKLVNVNNFQTSSPSEDSESEQKYLEIIDLLTVKMFDNDPKRPENLVKSQHPPKKSNSLPRTMPLELRPPTLQKSSSQNFNIENQSGGTSAYERLFGRPRPGKK